MKFPKELYITIHEEGEDSYLLAHNAAEDVVNSCTTPIEAAIYKLVERVVVTTKAHVTTK
jgi:hypothetical protein